MLNYEVDPAILLPLLPRGTELDSWNGKTFVSVVGFLFMNARVLGVPIPFHRSFEEVNLRFYVRRKFDGEWRRGVVFVKEIVPRLAIALTARYAYNENYIALPMSHMVRTASRQAENVESVRYSWQYQGREHSIELFTRGAVVGFVEGSEEEFITQHYWGYSAQKDGGTVEYRVEHPTWSLWQAGKCSLDCDVENLYGKIFAEFLKPRPSSAFLAKGSAVTVYKGQRLDVQDVP